MSRLHWWMKWGGRKACDVILQSYRAAVLANDMLRLDCVQRHLLQSGGNARKMQSIQGSRRRPTVALSTISTPRVTVVPLIPTRPDPTASECEPHVQLRTHISNSQGRAAVRARRSLVPLSSRSSDQSDTAVPRHRKSIRPPSERQPHAISHPPTECWKCLCPVAKRVRRARAPMRSLVCAGGSAEMRGVLDGMGFGMGMGKVHGRCEWMIATSSCNTALRGWRVACAYGTYSARAGDERKRLRYAKGLRLRCVWHCCARVRGVDGGERCCTII